MLCNRTGDNHRVEVVTTADRTPTSSIEPVAIHLRRSTSAGLSLGSIFGRAARIVAAFGETSCIEHPGTREVAYRLDVPIHLVQLFLAAEDKRFWFHPGIDPLAIARAATMLALGRGPIQGGSTITEQLLKLRENRLSTRSFTGRAARAFRSMGLCLFRDKKDLLAEYLSRIYLGRNCFGIHAAALSYFSRPPRELSHAESFFLCDRIALPNRWRCARVANLLRRPSVTIVIRGHHESLPWTYGRCFGPDAEREISRVVQAIRADSYAG